MENAKKQCHTSFAHFLFHSFLANYVLHNTFSKFPRLVNQYLKNLDFILSFVQAQHFYLINPHVIVISNFESKNPP